MYVEKFGLDAADDVQAWDGIDDEGWTGAEIKSCCRLAALLGVTLEEAAKKVVPVCRSAADSILSLRETSENSGYLDANTGEAYRRLPASVKTSNRRNVIRNGSK